MIRRTASSIFGAALAALAFAALTLEALSKETNDEQYTFAPYPYATNELTKAEFRSRFWDTGVRSKGTQILSRVFRLNTAIKGDENENNAKSVGSTYAALRQLNILPA